MVFDQVLADLEAEGYETIPFLLPACAVNAPHRRDRIWIIAHEPDHASNPTSMGRKRRWSDTSNGIEETGKARVLSLSEGLSQIGPAPDTGEPGLQEWIQSRREQINRKDETLKRCELARTHSTNQWGQFPTQPPVRTGTHGLSGWMVKNINQEFYATISKGHTIEDLRKMRESIQSEAFWESFGGLDEILEPEVLLEVVRCCETSRKQQSSGVKSKDEETIFEGVLRKVRNGSESPDTSQRRKLEKQLAGKLDDFMLIVPYEFALATMALQEGYQALRNKQSTNAIKALGNAIVPQVAFELFKVINQMER